MVGVKAEPEPTPAPEPAPESYSGDAAGRVPNTGDSSIVIVALALLAVTSSALVFGFARRLRKRS